MMLAVAGQKELKMWCLLLGQGNNRFVRTLVWERVIVVATPEKGVVAAPKSTTKRGCGQSFCTFIRICGLTNLCLIPGKFFTKAKLKQKKAKGISNGTINVVSLLLLGFLVTWIFRADALNAFIY
jgi:hypothetical protein